MAFFDVSVTIRAAMPVFPGNPPVSVTQHQRIADGAPANVGRLDAGLHTGTHVDAPRHFVDGAAGAEALPLDVLVGPALVVDATAAPGDLDAAAIDALAIPQGTQRVLLHTRNSALWADAEFAEDFVAIAADGARRLIALGARLVGIDYLSVGDPATHHALIAAGVVPLEGIDLSVVPAGAYELLCLPLKIEGADGAPARVLLRTL